MDSHECAYGDILAVAVGEFVYAQKLIFIYDTMWVISQFEAFFIRPTSSFPTLPCKLLYCAHRKFPIPTENKT